MTFAPEITCRRCGGYTGAYAGFPDQHNNLCHCGNHQSFPIITQADIEAAVLAEREACAKVCDGLAIDFPIGSSNCATAIRAMGEK